MLRAIACVSRNWGIGQGQALLFHIPEDMAWFKEHTMGSTVVLGRKTLESFPGGRPLPGRRHLVLSHDFETEYENVIVLDCMEKVLKMLNTAEDAWVIGGEQVYRQLLPHCGEAYITKVDALPDADRFFPDLDALPGWRLEWQSEERESGGLRYRFCRYVNEKRQSL